LEGSDPVRVEANVTQERNPRGEARHRAGSRKGVAYPGQGSAGESLRQAVLIEDDLDDIGIEHVGAGRDGRSEGGQGSPRLTREGLRDDTYVLGRKEGLITLQIDDDGVI